MLFVLVILIKQVHRRHYIFKTVGENLLVKYQGVLQIKGYLLSYFKVLFLFQGISYQDLLLFFESSVLLWV